MLSRLRSLIYAISVVLVAFPAVAMNMDLSKLVAEDQSDRRNSEIRGGALSIQTIGERDKTRRSAVKTMLAGGEISAAVDFENAALIMQHGETPDDFQLANSLATVAVAIDPNRQMASWLVAATLDRLLLSRGKPQWYGTQFTRAKNGEKPKLLPFDASAVSDAERASKHIPPASELLKEAEK